MEVSFKYILVRINSFLSVFFALFFIGEHQQTLESLKIENNVKILTGVCISIYYVYKLFDVIANRDKKNNFEERISELEKKANQHEKPNENIID